MKLLEIIELRTAAGNAETIEAYLGEWIRDSRQTARLVKSYRHVSLETDFSIHLSYESTDATPVPATSGKQLAASLRDFGLVHRSVWVEHDFDAKATGNGTTDPN